MRRRSRLLRFAKWGGVAVCVVLLLAIIASFFVTVEFTFEDGTSDCQLSLGCIYYRDGSLNASMVWPAGWFVHRTTDLTQTMILPSWRIPYYFAVPLWIVLMFAGVGTGLLFRLARRPIPGHCPCGYDLTGNVSGTCPECGRAAPSDQEHARGDRTP